MRSLFAIALGLSFACASSGTAQRPTIDQAGTAPLQTSAGTSGGTCTQASLSRGTVIYSRADSAYPMLTVSTPTNVCVDPSETALGFRHIKLSNGQDGFVAESDLG